LAKVFLQLTDHTEVKAEKRVPEEARKSVEKRKGKSNKLA